MQARVFKGSLCKGDEGVEVIYSFSATKTLYRGVKYSQAKSKYFYVIEFHTYSLKISILQSKWLYEYFYWINIFYFFREVL